MMQKMFHCVAKLDVLGPDGLLRLHFDDGSVRDIVLADEAQRGTAFAQLTDLDYVRAARLTNRGHIIEFPDGMTWSAQACWEEARTGANGATRKPAAVRG